MDQHFSEMNNLRNSYCDVLCQQYNYHPVYYQNSQEFFHKTDNFQSYNHSKDHFFSNDYAILEPEYFLNIQNIDESKVIEELTLPSNNHDSFISQFSQSHQQCFNEYNRDEQKILTQNDNDGNSLFHQLQQQQELVKQTKPKFLLTQDLNNQNINTIKKQQQEKDNNNDDDDVDDDVNCLINNNQFQDNLFSEKKKRKQK